MKLTIELKYLVKSTTEVEYLVKLTIELEDLVKLMIIFTCTNRQQQHNYKINELHNKSVMIKRRVGVFEETVKDKRIKFYIVRKATNEQLFLRCKTLK